MRRCISAEESKGRKIKRSARNERIEVNTFDKQKKWISFKRRSKKANEYRESKNR